MANTDLTPGTGKGRLGLFTDREPGVGSLALAGITGRLAWATLTLVGTLTATGAAPLQSWFVTPGTRAMALAGTAPSVDRALTPGSGSLTATGVTPLQSWKVTPATGSLTIASHVLVTTSIEPPTGALRLGILGLRTPTVGALALLGQAPTVSESGVPVAITPDTYVAKLGLPSGASASRQPGTASLVFVGVVVEFEVREGVVKQPGSGELVLGIDDYWVFPTTGALTLTGGDAVTSQVQIQPAATTLSLVAGVPSLDFHVATGAGSLELAGYPLQWDTTMATAAGGTLTLAGHAPTLLEESPPAAVVLSPGAGALALGGANPTLTPTVIITVQPDAGALTFGGDVTSTVWAITPDSGALAFSGVLPAQYQTLTPDSGALILNGSTPHDPNAGGQRARYWQFKPWKIPIGPTHVQVL